MTDDAKRPASVLEYLEMTDPRSDKYDKEFALREAAKLAAKWGLEL